MYIDDCVDLLLELQKKLTIGEHKIYQYNDKKVTLASVAEKIIKITSSKSKISLDEGIRRVVSNK